MKPANRLSDAALHLSRHSLSNSGGKKLPELGAGPGKGIASFRNGLKELDKPGKKVIS